MDRFSVRFSALIWALLVAGCGQPQVTEEHFEQQVQTVVAATLANVTIFSTPTTTRPIPTQSPVTITPQPWGEIYVYTTVDNSNLRVNPGTLFKVSRVMVKNTRLRLLGMAPGGEWLSVMNDEGISGWVATQVVLLAYDGPRPPIIEPKDVRKVTGSVLTELGTPLHGIGFAFVQGARRTDAVTDESGIFHAYFPTNLTGTWELSYVSIACTSNVMDVNCNCISGQCGSVFPSPILVQVPQSETLQFVWK